jgi:chromosome segregation ATPase
MRILEALSIVDDAVYQCKEKSVDTPDVNEALDLLQVQLPRLRQQIDEFRKALKPRGSSDDGLEAQQRELRERIPPIHKAVRNKLKAYLKTLEFRYKVKPDDKTKTEIERLTIKLEGLPEQWGFFPW